MTGGSSQARSRSAPRAVASFAVLTGTSLTELLLLKSTRPVTDQGEDAAAPAEVRRSEMKPSLLRTCALSAFVCLLQSACASVRTPQQVEDLLTDAVEAAWTLLESDLDPEAAVLCNAISAVDQRYPGLSDLERSLDPELRARLDRSLLGMNRGLRPPAERSRSTRIQLWLPDRLLDLLDVVTLSVHLGPGLYADPHVTRGLQVAGGLRSTGGIGLHETRSLGLKSQSEAGLSLLAAGTHSYGGALIGTSGLRAASDGTFGLHRPMDELYQEMRDYWAVGASATAIFIGAEFDLHPLQLADFLAGFVGLDFLNDDFGRTRGLELDPVEWNLLAELGEVRRSPESVEAYLASRQTAPGPLLDEPETPAPDDPAAGTQNPASEQTPAAAAPPGPE